MRATAVVVFTLVTSSAQAANVRLTIVSAKIDPAKVKGGKSMATASLSDLACLSLPGLREIAGLCGGQIAPADRPTIDPFVRVEIRDRVIRTYPVPGSFMPKWDYGVIFDRAFLDAPESAAFILYDNDGPGVETKLGDALLKTRDLLKPGTRVIKVGAGEITYRVDPLVEKAGARKYRFRVPADQQMADLARNAKTSGPGYVVIPVSEGELVDVEASGQVQPNVKKYPERVAGPNGIPTIQTKIQFNQPGFRGCPGCDHAALIGQIGSTGLVIGEHKQFTVENAGLLVLAINDLKVVDNAGGFDVNVTVSLPASKDPRALGKAKGSAGDSGPAGIDPRVVQQTVDQHGAEIEACALAEPNPYGEVVLQFSISADGTLLGAIVERASPNLKKAGECMRQKALKWKFPPPHGAAVARYPVSFSPG